MNDTINEFNDMWNSSRSYKLTQEWIDNYTPIYEATIMFNELQKESLLSSYKLVPNKMQVEALNSIEDLRRKGQRKGMIISSTGERVIIVMGAINLLVSRFSGTFIKYNSCAA